MKPEPIQIIHLQPDDVILIKHSGILPAEAMERIHQRFKERFPNHNPLIVDSRVSVSIHRKVKEPPVAAAAG